mmetsp:Transcript_15787/g.25960  ORF Transcript_15787/g.25960 Transcript_15787/m.25960 type:complete len:241 (-) Transcript_15787:329-1051(-)
MRTLPERGPFFLIRDVLNPVPLSLDDFANNLHTIWHKNVKTPAVALWSNRIVLPFDEVQKEVIVPKHDDFVRWTWWQPNRIAFHDDASVEVFCEKNHGTQRGDVRNRAALGKLINVSHYMNKVSTEQAISDFQYHDENMNLCRPALGPQASSTFFQMTCGLDHLFLECGACNRSSDIAPSLPSDPTQISIYKRFYSGIYGIDFSDYTYDPSRINLGLRKYKGEGNATCWTHDELLRIPPP